MTRSQKIKDIEASLRRAAEAIRRRDPDALAGRMLIEGGYDKRALPQNAKATAKKRSKA
jgi:hypothetical protein